jgi:subtilisin-like proprotein convertase family protein
VDITTKQVGLLNIYLTGPDGTIIRLYPSSTKTGQNFTGTTFDDEAATSITAGAAPYSGSYRPLEPLGTFDGLPAQGTWTLTIGNWAGGFLTTLKSWSLVLTTSTASGVASVDMMSAVAEVNKTRA